MEQQFNIQVCALKYNPPMGDILDTCLIFAQSVPKRREMEWRTRAARSTYLQLVAREPRERMRLFHAAAFVNARMSKVVNAILWDKIETSAFAVCASVRYLVRRRKAVWRCSSPSLFLVSGLKNAKNILQRNISSYYPALTVRRPISCWQNEWGGKLHKQLGAANLAQVKGARFSSRPKLSSLDGRPLTWRYRQLPSPTYKSIALWSWPDCAPTPRPDTM